MFYLSLRVNLVKFENKNEYDLNEKEKEGKGQERSNDETRRTIVFKNHNSLQNNRGEKTKDIRL